MSAFNVFRSATTSLSARSLSAAARRPATAHRRALALGARAYSSQNGSASPDASSSKADADGPPADNPCADVEAKLKAKEAEVVDITVRLLRIYCLAVVMLTYPIPTQGRLRYLQADFLNLQRNSAREKEQTRDFAITRFAGDLLETVDVLALALKSVPAEYASSESAPPQPSGDKQPADHLRELYNGVELTHRLLLQTLFKYHVKPFDPTGDKFDPNRHEALYQAPVPGKEPGSVIDCQKTGFMIKDRVLRAAQVGVAQDVQS
jgi:molecular chaperone GrpE